MGPSQDSTKQESVDRSSEDDQSTVKVPTITLPKGGGAIRGIGEKFAANPVTGTGSMSVPIITSPGRSGFGPRFKLFYDSDLPKNEADKYIHNKHRNLVIREGQIYGFDLCRYCPCAKFYPTSDLFLLETNVPCIFNGMA